MKGSRSPSAAEATIDRETKGLSCAGRNYRPHIGAEAGDKEIEAVNRGRPGKSRITLLHAERLQHANGLSPNRAQ